MRGEFIFRVTARRHNKLMPLLCEVPSFQKPRRRLRGFFVFGFVFAFAFASPFVSAFC